MQSQVSPGNPSAPRGVFSCSPTCAEPWDRDRGHQHRLETPRPRQSPRETSESGPHRTAALPCGHMSGNLATSCLSSFISKHLAHARPSRPSCRLGVVGFSTSPPEGSRVRGPGYPRLAHSRGPRSQRFLPLNPSGSAPPRPSMLRSGTLQKAPQPRAGVQRVSPTQRGLLGSPYDTQQGQILCVGCCAGCLEHKYA